MKKEVINLKIKGTNSNEAFLFRTTDSISLPLKNIEKTTSYSFIKEAEENMDNSGNKDHVLINYKYKHIYISRACGYKSNFLIIYLVLLSIVLEILHIFIPMRSFEFPDLFGNLLGVLIILMINFFYRKYENFKN